DDLPFLRHHVARVQQQADRHVLPFLLIGRDVELCLARGLERALDRGKLGDDARPERIDDFTFEEVDRLADDLLQPRRGLRGVAATPRRAISAANFGASPSVFTTSSTNAFASLWRRKGSLNRHFPISVSMALSMFALIAFGFGGCSSTIFAAISAAFLPWYAGRPVAISK